MFSKLVLFSIYLNCVLCSLTHYKASVVDVSKTEVTTAKYESLILEAAKSNVDLLVLSPTKVGAEAIDSCVTNVDNYDEAVMKISKAAKAADIYVVAQIYEKRCQYRDEALFNNMVFDRDGRIVAAYRTPASTASKCNATESKIIKFTTDFGVTFALVTEEDIVLHRIEYFDGIRNFIVSGFASNISYSFVEQFTSSWSFINKVNVVSPAGLFGANMDASDNLIIAEMQKNGGSPSLISTSPPHEDLHHPHRSTKSLNTEASLRGYTDTVCDGNFCCNFYVKTSDKGPSTHLSLWAHREELFLPGRRVHLPSCGVSSRMPSGIKFERISVTANLTEHSVRFPTVTTRTPTRVSNLVMRDDAVELIDAEVISFSLRTRHYSEDDFVESLSEDVNDFFDYVWIRVRVPIFVVSIYVLEML